MNQFRGGGAALGFLIAYYQHQAGLIPQPDLVLVASAYVALVSTIGDYLHGFILEQTQESDETLRSEQDNTGSSEASGQASLEDSTRDTASREP
ncbi:MAG: hypothetical protein ABEJ72_04480, partial [Candidatus Aenigmatarchaeota archaeon]